ncbi:MAG: hypothetical protein V3T58_00210 [Candidatus Hydrothermarchaeales archaeon]
MEFPSFLLKALGAFLVILGFIGVMVGVYAITVVRNYDGEAALATADLRSSLSDTSASLRGRKLALETSIGDSSSNLKAASLSIDRAGSEVHSASTDLSSASGNLNAAAVELEGASRLNAEAGLSLNASAQGLREWADSYEFNGSPLPGKASFELAIDNMSTASSRLEAAGDKIGEASKGIEKTASDLGKTSKKLEGTSASLVDVGSKLKDAGESIDNLRAPLVGIVSEVAVPLEDSVEGMDIVGGMLSRAKSLIYVAIGYFILVHLVFIGLGIALITIEVNLGYPG